MFKKLFKSTLTFIILCGLVGISSFNVFADEAVSACTLSSEPIPAEGEAILLEDNSYEYTFARAPAVKGVSVNKTYSVRIQDSSGSCASSATVKVSGNYTYNTGTGEVLSASLSASFSSVPSLWTAEIQSQWKTISGSSLTYSIYYYSRVDDPYSCMVGGGNWYSGATFTIK